jgi:hypothetical protein
MKRLAKIYPIFIGLALCFTLAGGSGAATQAPPVRAITALDFRDNSGKGQGDFLIDDIWLVGTSQ